MEIQKIKGGNSPHSWQSQLCRHLWHIGCALALILGALLGSSSVSAQSSVLPTVITAGSGEQPLMMLAPAQLSPLEADFIKRHPVLRVAVAGVEYLPYQTVVDGKLGGYSIQFLEAIARANGFRLEYQVYATWGEVLDALENREADLTPSASISADRERYLGFTAGITPDPSGLVGRIGDDRFTANPLLEGMRVAVGREFVAESFLKDQFPKAIPIGIEVMSEALELLASGEVDYYFGALANVFFSPDKDLVSKVEVKQRVFFSTGWTHIAIRSDWPLLKRLFDRFVREGSSGTSSALSEVVGERLEVALPQLNTTPDETRFLRKFTELKVGTVTGFPLLNSTDDNGLHTGIASEFTAYIAYQLGLPVTLVNFESVGGMLEALHDDEIDLIPFFGITEARRDSLRFSDPYLNMPWLAVSRRDDVLYWDLGSLRGKTLAIRENHPLRPVVEARYPSLEIMITDTAEQSIEAVAKGRADTAVESKLYVNRLVSQSYAGELRVLGEVRDDPGAYGYAVSPANELMVPMLNRALASMQPGFVDRVTRRWVAVDFAPETRFKAILRILVPVLIATGLFLLFSLYLNSRTCNENQRRLKAEQRLVDMTERLRTGVFQFRQYPGLEPQLEFSNRITREMGRVPYEEADAESLRFFEYIDAADREFIQSRLRHSLKTGEHFRETFRFEFPEGEKGWIVCDGHCREEEDGARVWSGYLFDMTSERMLTEELNSLLADRDEFVSMASHELRTPVQNVAMSLDSIETEAVPAQDRKTLARAKAACKDLEELVNDIVQMTVMNHHSPVLTHDPLNISDLVSTVSKSFAASASRKSLEYSVGTCPLLPEFVLGDALRIKQVLYNLVGNAIKYTDSGSVHVYAKTLPEKSSKSECVVVISVSDTGLGIAEDQLGKIFEPFATVGPSSRRDSGLGLALSDRLAAVMGGRIQVSSTLGKGSTFTVELPLQVTSGTCNSQLEDSQSAFPSASQWYFESNSLLLVDDNLLVREAVSSMLQSRGWTVLKADSAPQALSILQSQNIKAVVTDQQMPGMTGIDLAREIRAAHEPGEPRPVLILMSGGMSRDNSAQAAGLFDAMLFKPVKAEQIRAAVDGVINRASQMPARLTGTQKAQA